MSTQSRNSANNELGAVVLEFGLVVIVLAVFAFAVFSVNSAGSEVQQQKKAAEVKSAQQLVAPKKTQQELIIAAAKTTPRGYAVRTTAAFVITSVSENDATGVVSNTAGSTGYKFKAHRSDGSWAIVSEE